PTEHRGHNRPVRAAGFHPVPYPALRLCPLEDRLYGPAHLGGRTAWRLAAAFSRRPARGLRPAPDPSLDAGLSYPVLRLQPIQAQRDAERTQGFRRRITFAP